MKFKKISFVTIALIVLLCFCFGSCSVLKKDKTYIEYYFSNENASFYASTRTVTFKKDGSFSMSAYGTELIKGKYTDYKTDKYIRMIYENEITDEKIAEYRDYLSDEGMNFTAEEIKEMLTSVTLYDDYYYYKNYLFSNDAIAAYRQIDLEKDTGYNYTSIDGEYVVGNNKETYLLKLNEGIAYSKSIKSDSETAIEYTKVGTYTVEKDFLVLSVDTSEGTTRLKYLIARFAIPTDVAYEIETQMDGDPTIWTEKVQDALISLEGREITCLVKYFFTTEKLA